MAIKYLATTGIDTPTGGAIGAPFATYDYALLHTTDDDLILARGGDYNQYINNTACNGLSTSARRRIANYPGETVWMKPTSGDYVLHFFSSQTFIEFDGINMDARGNHFGAPIRLEAWEFGDPHHINIKNATIILGSDGVNPVDPTTGGPMGILAQAVFAGRTGAHGFYNLKLQGGGDPGDYCYGMYIETHDCIVDGCEFDNTGNAGIQIYNYYGLGHGFRPMRNIIRNSYFHDITRTPNGNVWGIIDAGDGTKIYSNRFLRIGGANGAAISLFASLNVEVYNNSIYNGTTAGIKINPDNPNVLDAIIRNNIAYQNAGGNYIAGMGVRTIEDHNMFSTTDPKWVNASAGDFTLQSSSPAIGTGIVVPYATTDYLGNARGVTFDIGAAEYMSPVIPLSPTNISPATAVNLDSLPASVSQNVHDSGTTYTVWYKYTAVAGDLVLGLFAFGDLVGYAPTTQIFEGLTAANAENPKYYQIGSEIAVMNKPCQFAVTVGQTYYFKLTRNNATVTPAMLSISLQRAPNLAIPIGSILINDDDIGPLPLAILSGTDGTNLGFRWPFAGGDTGAILPNGISIFGHVVDSTVKVYGADLSLIATVNPFSGSDPIICCSNKSDKFYVCDQNTGKVTTISSTGVQGPTTWNLPVGAPDVKVIAVSQNNTILYYFTNTAGDPIKRWDLVNNVAMSDFVAGMSGHFMTFDMLVLQDGTILAGYQKNTVTVNYLVRRYDAAGNILNTYGFGITKLNRIAFALDDPLSFWAWFLIADDKCEFRNIRISDGTVITTFTTSLYNVGNYQPAANATPARFGHSQSCPFLILNHAITPPVTPDISGIYYINPTKVTKHDSYYYDTEKKIPDPTIKTALLGE